MSRKVELALFTFGEVKLNHWHLGIFQLLKHLEPHIATDHDILARRVSVARIALHDGTSQYYKTIFKTRQFSTILVTLRVIS